MTPKVAGSTPGFYITTLGKLFTHTCFTSIILYRYRGGRVVMPCGWEDNRRSGVALAMRHRLQWFIHLRAQSHEHPAYTPGALPCGSNAADIGIAAGRKADVVRWGTIVYFLNCFIAHTCRDSCVLLSTLFTTLRDETQQCFRVQNWRWVGLG